MLAGDFAPGFMIDLQVKDLRLVEEAAAAVNLTLNASQLVQKLFIELQKRGEGKAGTQALFQAVQAAAR
jgi:2-hydroxy-3-oxopropionate reductase